MDEEGVLDFLTSLEAMDLPDRIEEVNAKILAKIIEETDYVAVLFCKCNISYTDISCPITPNFSESLGSNAKSLLQEQSSCFSLNLIDLE